MPYSPNMLGIIGASGKLGFATLSALLSNNLILAGQVVCTTSATDPLDPRWRSLAEKGVIVRRATFEDAGSIESALEGCDRLFLVSSPRISLDFNDAAPGAGREKDHILAIDAAKKAGIKHIYYTSLAFQNPSKAGVMQAHIRTEAYLSKLEGIRYTIIREGLYNESWPLYFGHYDIKSDERAVVEVGGDGPISWTSIPDLGLANALVLVAPANEYAGKTLYLSNTQGPRSLKDIAEIVSAAKGKNISLKFVTRQEHEKFYIEKRNMDEGLIKWWASTYPALTDGECAIKDTTLESLLSSKGKIPERIEDTVREMLGSGPK